MGDLRFTRPAPNRRRWCKSYIENDGPANQRQRRDIFVENPSKRNPAPSGAAYTVWLEFTLQRVHLCKLKLELQLPDDVAPNGACVCGRQYYKDAAPLALKC
jgi:hypothetical protein